MAFKLPEKRDQLIVVAKLAEQCERYDEMLCAMKRVVKLSADLQPEERNLLSVAYKNVIGTRRACWRAVASLETKVPAPQTPLLRAYKKQIEAEIAEICNDVLQVLEKLIIPAAPSEESKVYFYKMKGDYHRYYAEIATGEDQKEKAHESYNKAKDFAGHLKATNPIRLGLALNQSVFYYEILKVPDKGCQLARQAFEEALNDPEVLDEEQHKEAALIMQLLRDNLALWMEEDPARPDDGMKLEEL